MNVDALQEFDIPVMKTVPELSKRYGISQYTIRKWTASGKISFVKAGRKILIYEKNFNDFLTQNKEDLYAN